jgi:hypothetical protein
MVFCGDLGGCFSGSKKYHLFENVSVDFLVTLGGDIQEDGGDQKVG